MLYKFFVEERSVIERNRALKQVGHLFQLQLSRACKLSYRAVAVSSFVLDAANAKLNSFSFLEKVAGALRFASTEKFRKGEVERLISFDFFQNDFN